MEAVRDERRLPRALKQHFRGVIKMGRVGDPVHQHIGRELKEPPDRPRANDMKDVGAIWRVELYHRGTASPEISCHSIGYLESGHTTPITALYKKRLWTACAESVSHHKLADPVWQFSSLPCLLCDAAGRVPCGLLVFGAMSRRLFRLGAELAFPLLRRLPLLSLLLKLAIHSTRTLLGCEAFGDQLIFQRHVSTA